MATNVAVVETDRVPNLLVSVRNADEAVRALAGGCGIVDVKEPLRGSLGMADIAAISDVLAVVDNRAPVSAALGEVTDLPNDSAIPALPAGLSFAKLGMAGLGQGAAGLQRWIETRRIFTERSASDLSWVAVAYVDWKNADAPAPEQVIHVAAESDCRVVLFDTFEKTGGSLLDWASTDELARWIDAIHEFGMRAALAGGVVRRNLEKILPLEADIIGIRGAACTGGTRTDGICEEAVRGFKCALTAFHPSLSVESVPSMRVTSSQ